MTLKSPYFGSGKDAMSEHTITLTGKLQAHYRDQILIVMTTVLTEHIKWEG